MASIEQDDIFNVQDDDLMEEDDNNQEYNDMNLQQGDNEQDEELVADSDGAGDDSDGEGDDSNGEGDDSDSSNDESDDDDEEEEEEEEEESQDNNTQDTRDVDDDNDDDEDDDDDDDDESTRKRSESSNNLKQSLENNDKGEEDNDDDKMDVDSKQDSHDGHDDQFSHLSPRERMIAKAKIASEFDIIPSVALPYTSQCQSLAFTDGPKWILTGGEDGFIRKYDFISSILGKNLLTTAQRQNLVDSITKAGVIVSYWENEQPVTRKELMAANPKIKSSDFQSGSVVYEPKINPVYALEAEKNGYWCLSGLSSGGIALYTMRHNEGAIHHYFKHGDKRRNKPGHTEAISVLRLNQDQDKLLSGSWDKSIKQWDLNTGNCITSFAVGTGQLSSIQFRPQGLTDLSIPFEDSSDIKEEHDEDVDSLFGNSDEEETNQKTDENQEKKSSSQVVSKTYNNNSIFMSSTIDGIISIWDVRTQDPVLKFGISDGIPPWCMSATWSNCGEFIYAGRRNSTVEEFSMKMPHKRSKTGSHIDMMVPNVSKLLSFPKISGPVTALATMPNNNFLLCGSNDNIRLYNLQLYDELGLGSAGPSARASSSSSKQSKKPATPFLIIPGHQGGILSCLHVDETGRFMVSASGNRGWGHSSHTEAVLVYEIDFEG